MNSSDDIISTPKKKCRSNLTPLTPRIILTPVRLSEPVVSQMNTSDIISTPKKRCRRKLMPLTPRIILTPVTSSDPVENHTSPCSLQFSPSEDEYVPSSDKDSDSDCLSTYNTPEKKSLVKRKLIYNDESEEEAFRDVPSTSFNIDPLNIESENEDNVGIISGTNVCNAEPFYVPPIAPDNKWSKKYHFCLFCNTKVTRFARHIGRRHKDINEVKDFLALAPNSTERVEKINALRKQAMFAYNTNGVLNNGDLIVTRRPKQKFQRTVDNYVPCTNCKGFYRTSTLAKHYKLCTGEKKITGIRKAGRMLLQQKLPEHLQHIEDVLASGRNDSLTLTIRNDEGILEYGARLSAKYLHAKHMDNHIRSDMRMLARLVIEIRERNTSIKNLLDCLHPRNFDLLLIAVHKLCCYDRLKRCFTLPSAAVHIGNILPKVCDTFVTKFIKEDNPIMQRQVETYKTLVKMNYNMQVVAVANANLTENKMSKPKLIPLTADICKLNKYLHNGAKSAYDQLQNHFSYLSWYQLATHSLILLMIFNRRRTGEAERLSLESYNLKSAINKNSDVYESLTNSEKIMCHKFQRIVLRGKWGRYVPMLLNETHIKYIDTILKFRSEAGVSGSNPYIFGTKENSHLFAGKVLRDASKRCGAIYPETLRGTQLRKQIATVTQLVDMSDSDIKLLSKFMGHSQLIHEEHYRKTDSTLQVARLSKLLSAFNDGNIDQYRGKKLEDISIENDDIEEIMPTSEKDCKEVCSKELRTPDTKRKSTISRRNKCQDENNSPNTCFEACEDLNTPNNKKKINRTRSHIPNINSPSKPLYVGQRSWAPKIPWTTPEKKIVNKLFGQFLERGKVPTPRECEHACTKNPALKLRTGGTLYAYINNLNRRKKQDIFRQKIQQKSNL